jgi:hypothetical protein
MLYTFYVTVPGGTPATWPRDAPMRVDVKPLERVVRQVQVVFPANAGEKVGVRLFNEDQLMMPAPTSPDPRWIIDTGATVTIDDGFPLRGTPFVLGLELFNENATGTDCLVKVRVVMESMTVLEVLTAILSIVRIAINRVVPTAVEEPEDK